ncbi:hypothetical protein V1L54_01355 [Streptomyces sp. TRM 70361]|uniref:hypothetical protein n=1 Tax=Streptomyces sp. TRM 70361 TaxID=3116553 RepID=UPI002E7B4706|nr:hypothetical protein [Streptomyces sp. TRM 70361]MEE1938076.1 hypothetical protein [Streptomyces sp. TRM 70361]
MDIKVNKNIRSAGHAARAGAVAALTALTLLVASPTASALYRDDGDDPGTGLSVAETLGLYVVTPLVLFLVIAGLVIVADRSSRKSGQVGGRQEPNRG